MSGKTRAFCGTGFSQGMIGQMNGAVNAESPGRTHPRRGLTGHSPALARLFLVGLGYRREAKNGAEQLSKPMTATTTFLSPFPFPPQSEKVALRGRAQTPCATKNRREALDAPGSFRKGFAHSHSIVAGGFELMSYTTRFTPGHLVDDPRRDAGQEIVGQAAPVGGHEVLGLDGADGHDVGVGAAVAHHAHALHRQEHGEGLGGLAVQAGLA